MYSTLTRGSARTSRAAWISHSRVLRSICLVPFQRSVTAIGDPMVALHGQAVKPSFRAGREGEGEGNQAGPVVAAVAAHCPRSRLCDATP